MTEGRSFRFQHLKENWALTQQPSPSEEGARPLGENGYPKMDLYETDDEVVVEIDLPGMDPHGICLQILDNQLILEGRRKHLPETGHYLRMERCFEDFRRIVPLPNAVRPEDVRARYERGVVVIRMPKIEERRRRAVRIEIK